MGAINSASLFFGVLTRLLTGVATMWVSGYCFMTVNASSGAAVSQVSRSSLARMAGMRCLALWISAMSLLAGMVTMVQDSILMPSAPEDETQRPAKPKMCWSLRVM